jgi:hypothetical protein
MLEEEKDQARERQKHLKEVLITSVVTTQSGHNDLCGFCCRVVFLLGACLASVVVWLYGEQVSMLEEERDQVRERQNQRKEVLTTCCTSSTEQT